MMIGFHPDNLNDFTVRIDTADHSVSVSGIDRENHKGLLLYLLLWAAARKYV
jgi:hypothetical protein